MIPSPRPSPIPVLVILVGCLLGAPLHGARAASEIIATRLTPSSVSARYGAAVPVSVGASGGTYVVPTRTGIEFRGAAAGDLLFGSFRTAGVVDEVAWSGRTAYLFAGDRGIVAVDATDSTNLVAIGGHDHLGALEHGAFARGSATLAAASESTLYLFRETSPGALSLLDARTYRDGRGIVRVQARSDSFLVLSVRSSPTLGMFLTLYRARIGAAPESLWEFAANGYQARDLAWPDAMAFVAVGDRGILPFDTETRLPGTAVVVGSNRLVRDIDADPGSVVAIGESRTYAQFTRGGAKGELLASEVDRLTAIEPFHVSIVGGFAVVSEDDQTQASEPDEVGQSLLEIFDVAQPAQPPRTTTTGAGRARRVALDDSFAYLADYTGGLRVYRAGSADTSLVGVLAPSGNARVYDISLDRVRHVAYLASGTGGLIVVDVTDPASPVPLASLTAPTLPGITVAVSVIDTGLVVVARRGGTQAGVTFVDVTTPASPIPRGSVNYPFVLDPRAFAVKDTIAFLADEFMGVLSIRFGNPDAPATLGPPSGNAARDLDLSGTRLIVGTAGGDVQVVDVFNTTSPVLLATVPAPACFGVAQLGETALALLGDGGALAIDLRNPSAPRARGVITIPGFSRDAVWVGDTLLIAGSFGLERFRASAVVVSDPALNLEIDRAAVRPRVRISWTAPPPAGMVGWNVYRDLGTATEGLAFSSWGVRVNDSLLSPGASSTLDDAVQAGTHYRYRLEAFFPDGSSRKAADGAIYVPSNSALGRVYPNPYRPRNGQTLTVPYRVLSSDGGKSIELRVFDPAGRLVRRIVSTIAAGGGFGSVTWDGRDERGRPAVDGVYFIQLDGPGIDDARQLILLR
jgi:hypothetical protein